MCRLMCYLGPSIAMDTLIAKPEHSLILQSRDASYHPGCPDKRNIRVNGDGFGLAWYCPDRLAEGACLVKFATPAWSCPNLVNLARYVETPLLFAHVRAASDGNTLVGRVSYENCHPFKYKRYTFMHNGGVPGFSCIKRTLLSSLSDTAFRVIEGGTDSEVFFAIFLDCVGPDLERRLTAAELGAAVSSTVARVLELVGAGEAAVGRPGGPPPVSLNICVSDGYSVVATRYRNSTTQDPPSLYYVTGSAFTTNDGELRPVDAEPARSVLISSEPLSRGTGWLLVPRNHMVVVATREDDSTWVDSVRVLPMRCHPTDSVAAADASAVSPSSAAAAAATHANPYLCSPKLAREPAPPPSPTTSPSTSTVAPSSGGSSGDRAGTPPCTPPLPPQQSTAAAASPASCGASPRLSPSQLLLGKERVSRALGRMSALAAAGFGGARGGSRSASKRVSG